MTQWRLTIPGSSGNLGPGFDSCGLALGITNQFIFSLAPQENYRLQFGGTIKIDNKYKQPAANYVIRSYETACSELGISAIPFTLDSDINIPLSAGMGSSGTAFIAGTTIALIRHKLERDNLTVNSSQEVAKLMKEIKPQILQMTAALEQHPDNVAPSIFGGFVISTSDILAAAGQHNYFSPRRHDVATEVKCLLIAPALEVATNESRQTLQAQVSRQDAVFNISHAALLASAFATGNYELLREAMNDKLHEAQRDTLYDYQGLKSSLLSAGALGAALSGSGPTVLCLCGDDTYKKLQAVAAEHFQQQQISYKDFFIVINNDGTQLELLAESD